jgi:hypothetical protein
MKSYRVFLLSRTKLLIFFQIREWGGGFNESQSADYKSQIADYKLRSD